MSDENFLTEAQIKETATGKVSLESGHPVEWVEEENYIFKLSHFKDDLIYWLKANGCLFFFKSQTPLLIYFFLQKMRLGRKYFTKSF